MDHLENLDWPVWIARWDRMQERYLAGREERFSTMAHLVRDTQPTAPRILDLGCGTGSVLAALMYAMPLARGTGVDFDPTLLLLAGKRLAPFGDRVQLIEADVRKESWMEGLPTPFDAVVSATALHWLSPSQSSTLYGQR